MSSQSHYCTQDENYVTLTLNGKIIKVNNIDPRTSLLTYIRDYAQLKGTKFMCREGGCGACIVNITVKNPASGTEKPVSVNSCLYPLYACHGSVVTTVEGIGSKQQGYHPVQQRLAHFYGTQCGYCSPGWVMAMYSLLKTNPNLKMKEIEESLGSNVCRCTGYRPILDAFKSFAVDSSEELQQRVQDIEDITEGCVASKGPCFLGCRSCVKKDEDDGEDFCKNFVEVALAAERLRISYDCGCTWYRVTSVKEIFEIFDMVTTYMLVGGNTSQGVFEQKYPSPPEAYIDVGAVAQLHDHRLSGGCLVLGANMTMSDAVVLFRSMARDKPYTFCYLAVLARHIEKIGHIPLRNIATLAGSLATKHIDRRFQSDIFTIFEAVNAKLNIVISCGLTQLVSLPQYLDMDMYKKVIIEIILPPLHSQSYHLKTYKIARIAQNSHAYVNAGFLFKLSESCEVLEKPNLVYGGINAQFIHAKRTESYLVGKPLVDNAVLQEALSILDSEVQPDRRLPEASIQYRKGLVLSLFYRYVLSVKPELVRVKYRSGGQDIERPLSSGRQDFSSDPSLYPNNQPLPKLESLVQCAGELEFPYDIPVSKMELYAAFVITDRGPAVIDAVDPAEALAIKGVVQFLSAKDVPGKNTFTVINSFYTNEIEKLFSEGVSQYAGQAVGVVVACSQDLADFAASRVVIKYSAETKPLLTIPEVIHSGNEERVTLKPFGYFPFSPPKPDVTQVVKGVMTTSGQYHYHMECQVCVVHPSAEGLDVYSGTMWPMTVQEAVSVLLGIPTNKINVIVRRLGGGFGAKITRSNMVACACALAAHLTKRPVRMILTMETNMRAVGGRKPSRFEYEVGVNDAGEIRHLNATYYENSGLADSDYEFIFAGLGIANIYDVSNFAMPFFDVRSDRSTTCWMRAPGWLSAYASMETVLEHIAKAVGEDPLEVRLRNMLPVYSNILILLEEIKQNADYEARKKQCEAFNLNHLWKKRGISILPMRYIMEFPGIMNATVSIYRKDGSVSITHSGIEIGQGLNTQAAQACARALGVPLHYVQVKPFRLLGSANSSTTGGSVTGDSVVFAVMKCCETLNARLEPIRQSLVNPSWEQLIQDAYSQNVNLNALAGIDIRKDARFYNTFGVAVSEVEIDCLTGESKVIRSDILVDGGESVNPFIDIGQAEGAFVMGQGFFTCEELIYNEDTGHLTTNRSWEYKIPQAKDIPIELRVYLKKNSVNIVGPTRTKGISEPPMLLSWTIFTAMRYAIDSVRRDLGYPEEFVAFDPPATAENIFLTCGSDYKHYLI